MSDNGGRYLPLVELKEIFVTKTEYKALSDLFLDKLGAVERELLTELQENKEATNKLKLAVDSLLEENRVKVKQRNKRVNTLIGLMGALAGGLALLIGRILAYFGIK